MNADEPNYWFPAKRFGWGWGLPTVWQGWAAFIGWLIAYVAGVYYFNPHHSLIQLAFAAGMVLLLLLICYWKGEPPRWRWGK
jgi:hypothetical protein